VNFFLQFGRWGTIKWELEKRALPQIDTIKQNADLRKFEKKVADDPFLA